MTRRHTNLVTQEAIEPKKRSPSSPVLLRRGFPRGEQFFLGGLAQQSLDAGEGVGKLDVGEGVGKLDVGEGVVNFDIGREQPTLISFQPLDLKAEVVGHRFNSSPLGQLQPLP